MADVVELVKKRKNEKRQIVSVCYGGYQFKEMVQHVVKGAKNCGIPEDTGLLLVITESGERFSYPIGSVWFWSERDHPEDDDIA